MSTVDHSNGSLLPVACGELVAQLRHTILSNAHLHRAITLGI